MVIFGKTTFPTLATLLLLLGGCVGLGQDTEVIGDTANVDSSSLTQAASLASVCSGCHGIEVEKAGIVSLNGYSAKRISILFRGYKNDPVSTTTMHRMARGYTDEQIELIAMYLAKG